MKKPWDKKTALSQVTLALKTYGLTIEKHRYSMVDADFTAYWERTKKNYMFLVRETFTLEDSTHDTFKNVVTFCKTNNIKLIVISFDDPDELAGFTEDARSSASMGYKLIRFNQLEELYKDMLKIDSLT